MFFIYCTVVKLECDVMLLNYSVHAAGSIEAVADLDRVVLDTKKACQVWDFDLSLTFFHRCVVMYCKNY